MARIILLNKPFGVICQFSPSGSKLTLKDFVDVPDVYPAGRLDTDSEGLVVLTDDGKLQARIAEPTQKLPKTYWVQVEGTPTEADLEPLRRGAKLSDIQAKPALTQIIHAPHGLWERDPPIRSRAQIPTSWLEIVLVEGRNRQVRRMTASIGFPTLRLIRSAVGNWRIAELAPGEWRTATEAGWPRTPI